MAKTVFYARVSTAEQTLEHQVTQARAAGYDIADRHIVADHGVSGVSTQLHQREQGRRLYDLLDDGDTLVVRWIDRLGRNYKDVTEVLREFIGRGVTVKTIINNMAFAPTNDPMVEAIRDAQIAFLAAMAQAQIEANKEAQRAGIAHAKAKSEMVYRGRKPTYSADQVGLILDLAAQGKKGSEIGRTVGLSRQTVDRIIANPAAARAVIERWQKT